MKCKECRQKAVCEKEGVEFLPKECPCLKGCPHVCKDGEALLSVTVPCPCPCHKKPEEGFWKGNKRREGTEHIVYTMKDGEAVQTPEKCCKGFELDGVLFHECKEHRPYCAKDLPCCCTRDYYTRAEIDEKLAGFPPTQFVVNSDGTKWTISRYSVSPF